MSWITLRESTAVEAVRQEEIMSLKIGYLEDEKDLAEGLSFVIRDENPDVDITHFANSADILAFIDQECDTVDLFILDVRVPGPMDGLGVARHIRNLGCTAVIVVTSAYEPPPREVQQALNMHYFRKPWDLPDTVVQILSLVHQ
jgi:CheY-like chemotaxis protein